MEYDGEIAGQLNVWGIARGSLGSATIGYWVSKRFAGRGITPTAVALATDVCFTELRLHRMEICIRPENRREPARRREARLPLRGTAPPLHPHRRRLARPLRVRPRARRGARRACSQRWLGGSRAAGCRRRCRRADRLHAIGRHATGCRGHRHPVAYRGCHGWAGAGRGSDRARRRAPVARVPAAVVAQPPPVRRRRAQRGAAQPGAARARRDERDARTRCGSSSTPAPRSRSSGSPGARSPSASTPRSSSRASTSSAPARERARPRVRRPLARRTRARRRTAARSSRRSASSPSPLAVWGAFDVVATGSQLLLWTGVVVRRRWRGSCCGGCRASARAPCGRDDGCRAAR